METTGGVSDPGCWATGGLQAGEALTPQWVSSKLLIGKEHQAPRGPRVLSHRGAVNRSGGRWREEETGKLYEGAWVRGHRLAKGEGKTRGTYWDYLSQNSIKKRKEPPSLACCIFFPRGKGFPQRECLTQEFLNKYYAEWVPDQVQQQESQANTYNGLA